MNKRIIFLASFFFLVIAVNSYSAAIEKLTLKEAINYTLTANPSIKQSKNSLLTSKSQLLIASQTTASIIGADTSLESRNTADNSSRTKAFGSWQYSGFGGTIGSLDLTPFTTGDTNAGFSLQFRQPFVQGRGRLSDKGSRLLDAKSQLQIQQNQTFLSGQDAIISVVESYFNAVLAREQIKVQERSLATSQQQAFDARRRSDEGLIAEIEVSRAEIRVAQAKDNLNRAAQQAKGALDRLLLDIGEGMGQNPELVDAIPDTIPVLPDQDTALGIALKNRKSLANYDIQLSNKKRSLDLASDQLRPSIDAFANYFSSAQQNSVSRIFDNQDLTVGLEYSITLDKKIIKEQRNTTARDLDLLTQLRSYEVDKINNDIRNAYRSLDSAKISLNILDQNLKTAQDNLKMAQRMVEEGLSSNREVLDAQDSLSSVENGILNARVGYYLAALNVKNAIGEDLLVTVFK